MINTSKLFFCYLILAFFCRGVLIGIVARPKIPLGNDYKIGNIGRKIGNMSENNYPTYFSNPL